MPKKAGSVLRLSIWVVLISLGALGVISLFVSKIIAKELIRTFKEDCVSCSLEIKDLKYSILNPNYISMTTLHLMAGDPKITQIDAQIERVEINFLASRLFFGDLDVQQLQISNPIVLVSDGEGHSLKEAAKTLNLSLRLHRTNVVNGTLKYLRIYQGTKALLEIHHVNALVGELGSTPELIDHVTSAHLTAEIEQSGKVSVDIKATVFKRPLQVSAQVEIVGQNLPEVNRFFFENDGIELSGRLKKGTSTVDVVGRHLEAKTTAAYEGLNLKLTKTQERSQGLASLMNFGVRLVIHRQSAKLQKDRRPRMVSLNQELHESLISFMIRGMKISALKVAVDREF